MLRQRATLVARGLYAADLLLLGAAFVLAYWLRATFLASQYGQLVPLDRYLWLLAAAVPTWTLLLRSFGLYESFRLTPVWVEPWQLLNVTVWGTLLLTAITFAFKLHFVSRLFLALFGAVSFVLLAGLRLGLRIGARHVRRRGFNYRNVVVVGTGRRARAMARIIEAHQYWGLRLVGLVADGPVGDRPSAGPFPILGTLDRITGLLREMVVDEVIFAVSKRRLDDMESIFLACEELGIRTHVALNFFPHLIAQVRLEELGGIPLLTFTTIPEDEVSLTVKRVFDVVVSIGLLVVLAPVLLGVAVLVKVTSPGPVLFKQTRIGLNGRRFRLYKFRSMVRDAEARKAELLHLNEMDGPVFKIAKDPRLTRIGGFLRRTSLDELPQLFNVLRGDMSIVGPRPPVPEEVAQYQPWQRRRLSMKPGLTCLWQVNGRNGIVDFDDWMSLDLQYIDNWSLKLDAKIFLKTIPAVLFGKGAA